MSADWNLPTTTSLYTDVLDLLKTRDLDVATMFKTAPVNPVQFMMRFNRSILVLEEYDGVSAWVPVVLGVTGGGTGGGTAVAARTALGIGTMGVQDSNAVAITGGGIAGLTTFELGVGAITVDTDNLRDLATFAKQMRKGFFKSALVIPVGADKYATS